MIQQGPPKKRRNFEETVAFESITVNVPTLNLLDYSQTSEQVETLEESKVQFLEEGELSTSSKPIEKQKPIATVSSPIYRVGGLEWF